MVVKIVVNGYSQVLTCSFAVKVQYMVVYAIATLNDVDDFAVVRIKGSCC